jgi:hypothetical protein
MVKIRQLLHITRKQQNLKPVYFGNIMRTRKGSILHVNGILRMAGRKKVGKGGIILTVHNITHLGGVGGGFPVSG